jgi:hypothetical protein
MRSRLAGIPMMVLAAALTPCSIALAQNSVTETGASNNTTQPNNATQPAGPSQVEQPTEGGVNWKGVGVGAGTVAGNVLYMPAKLVYGILGGIAGGAGYALTGGNKQVADTIWRSSLGGDYILTPDMVKGEKPVHFSGPTDTAPQTQTDSTADTNASAPATGTAPAASTTGPGTGKDSSLSSAAIPPTDASSLSGTHPIDSGAGPVGGAVSSGSSVVGAPSTSGVATSGKSSRGAGTAPGRGSSSAPKSAPLPNTSIE